MKFTKEEKKELDASFKRVLEDIKELYDVSDMETYKKRIIFYNMNTYRFEINEHGIWLTYDCTINGNCVASFKRNGKLHIYPNPADLIFGFLNKYDEIREDLLKEAATNLQLKYDGLNKIRELENRYSKEATIEIIMPETINQSSIEVTQEDGMNVGKLTIGPVSLKILTTPNVRIINKGKNSKVKQK